MHTSMTSGRKVEAFRGSNAVSAVRIRTGRPLGVMKKCDQKRSAIYWSPKKGKKGEALSIASLRNAVDLSGRGVEAVHLSRARDLM